MCNFAKERLEEEKTASLERLAQKEYIDAQAELIKAEILRAKVLEMKKAIIQQDVLLKAGLLL